MRKKRVYNNRKNKKNLKNPEQVINTISDKVHSASTRALGNLRFSIKLRIAITHVWLLLRILPLAALLLAIAVGYSYSSTILRQRDAAIFEAADANLPFTSSDGVYVAPYNSDKTEKQEKIDKKDKSGKTGGANQADKTNIETDEERGLINAIDAAIPREMNVVIYKNWGFTISRNNWSLWATYAYDNTLMHFSLSSPARAFSIYGSAFLAVFAMLFISIITRGQRNSAKLLAPIGHIANTAQQLTEKNLSMRINIAGTQNELRDLALLVNAMLDRIESAYNRQKQFVSDASHELRTPIAVLQGYANLLARWGKDAPDVRDEAISAILNETESMKELVENLLFLARHDKRTLKMEPHPFSLADLITEVIKETELIAVNYTIDRGVIEDAALNADRSQIKQAIRIFIDNALKYTPPGGYISLSSRVSAGQCRISVSDTGIGISKDDLPKIFDRFYRSDKARNMQGGGHGLGLSIARIIVSSHGGSINVRSKPGSGTTFSISLPLSTA